MFTALWPGEGHGNPGRREGVSIGVTKSRIAAVLLGLFAVVGAACQTLQAPESMIRASHKGEAIPLLEGQAFSPGSPWGWAPLPRDLDSIAPNYIALTTGDFAFLIESGGCRDIISVMPGPMGIGPWPGTEMIFISSRSIPSKSAGPDFAERARNEVKKCIATRSKDPRDVSARYASRLGFWKGGFFAYSFKVDNEAMNWVADYQTLHVFRVVPSKKPGRHVVYDFSYVRMEKPGTKDNFEDFLAFLKTIRINEAPSS